MTRSKYLCDYHDVVERLFFPHTYADQIAHLTRADARQFVRDLAASIRRRREERSA